ncbi:hypothetical protein C8Q79DRAFT_511741 [Trametes meyenii]|nr:hypothetical protein C8Q79DRAFT_511741 [Trametes meyenii]
MTARVYEWLVFPLNCGVCVVRASGCDWQSWSRFTPSMLSMARVPTSHYADHPGKGRAERSCHTSIGIGVSARVLTSHWESAMRPHHVIQAEIWILLALRTPIFHFVPLNRRTIVKARWSCIVLGVHAPQTRDPSSGTADAANQVSLRSRFCASCWRCQRPFVNIVLGRDSTRSETKSG